MRLQDQQREAIARQAPREILIHAGAAALFTVALWGFAPQRGLLLAWLGAALLAGAGFGLLLHRRGVGSREFLAWRLWLGTQWGLAALFAHTDWPSPLQALLHALVAVLVIGALSGNLTRASYFVVFSVPALAAHSLNALAIGGETGLALALIDLMLMAVLLVLARRIAVFAGNAVRMHNKTAELEERLQWTARAFRDQQIRSKREEALARQVFDRLTRQTSEDASEINRWVYATGSFSGDLLLYADSPSGCLNILFCDFTGHGLPAALGAIPVSGVFYTMVRKEYAPGAIAQELNRRLEEMLPPDYFCCATLLRVSPERTTMQVCNAGLPPVLVIGENGNIRHRLDSHQLPLGITQSGPEISEQTSRLESGDVVYLFSDGLIESENARGEMFGLARLERKLAYAAPNDSRVDTVRNAVVDFIGVCEPSDDISLIELRPGAHAQLARALARAS